MAADGDEPSLRMLTNSRVAPGPVMSQLLLIEIETYGTPPRTKSYRKRQADISQADNGYRCVSLH